MVFTFGVGFAGKQPPPEVIGSAIIPDNTIVGVPFLYPGGMMAPRTFLTRGDQEVYVLREFIEKESQKWLVLTIVSELAYKGLSGQSKVLKFKEMINVIVFKSDLKNYKKY